MFPYLDADFGEFLWACPSHCLELVGVYSDTEHDGVTRGQGQCHSCLTLPPPTLPSPPVTQAIHAQGDFATRWDSWPLHLQVPLSLAEQNAVKHREWVQGCFGSRVSDSPRDMWCFQVPPDLQKRSRCSLRNQLDMSKYQRTMGSKQWVLLSLN